MCGISGIFSEHLDEQQHKIISEIVKSQYSRGPDNQTILEVKTPQANILLGHNRLSIIDLSAGAHQPLWDVTGRYCISYNGEIYNYIELRKELMQHGLAFNTQSDTEVILNAFALWGIDCLKHFNGPFSFALFDKETANLWLCRDRFGVRPLYYIQQNNVLYFASSTAVLAKSLNLKPDLVYLARGLKYLVFEDDTNISAYSGLNALEAGHYLKIGFNSTSSLMIQKNRYYDLHKETDQLSHILPVHDPEALLDLISHKLEDAVNIRLRADVPLGISLSSGLDSSSVAALVAKQHEQTIGFSFGHPSMKKTEGPLVAKCAASLDIKMHYLWPTQEEMIQGLFKTVEAQDAPFSSLSMVAQYLLYKKVNASGVKVLLGGQGGDESFMGYKKFLIFWLKELIYNKRYRMSAKNIIQFMPMLFAEMGGLRTYWQHRHRYFGSNKHILNALNLPEAPSLNLSSSPLTNLRYRQVQDITQFSLPTLLRYEDRNGMAHGIESRLPFVDYRLLELGTALPTAFKLRSGFSKWPIRQIMQHQLPASICFARYKRGFDISLTSLLKSGLGKSLRSVLQANLPTAANFLKKNHSIEKTFSDHELSQRPGAITEAISLLWLSQKGYL